MNRDKNLVDTFRGIDDCKGLIRKRVAKVCVGASTLKIFPKETGIKIKGVLEGIPVDELLGIGNQENFKVWFEKQLCGVAKGQKGSGLSFCG